MMVNLRVVKNNKEVENFDMEKISNSIINVFHDVYGEKLFPKNVVEQIVEGVLSHYQTIDEKRKKKGVSMSCLTSKGIKQEVYKHLYNYDKIVANKYLSI